MAHCGNSMAGDFVHSLTFTDILTGWTENRAVWGKGSQGVLREIEDIERNIVFPILGFDCDNGSEFLNHHLVRYFTARPKNPVMFTRSRPFQKNDNAFVEQKTGPTCANSWLRQVRQAGTGRAHQRSLQERMESLQQLFLSHS